MQSAVIISRHNVIIISRISRKLRKLTRMCVCVNMYMYMCVRVSREWIIIVKIEDHNFTDATNAHVNAS